MPRLSIETQPAGKAAITKSLHRAVDACEDLKNMQETNVCKDPRRRVPPASGPNEKD